MTQYIADESKLIRSSAQTPAGRAASFDGANDYIEISDIGDPGTGSLTVSAWVNCSGTTLRAVVTKNDNAGGTAGRWGMYLEATTGFPYVFAYVNSSSVYTAKSTVACNDSAWHLWTGVIDRTAGILRMYIDGYQVHSVSIAAIAGEDISSTIPLRFGRDTTGNYLLGKLRDIRCYNAALTAAEIAALYNATKTSGGDVAGTIYADRLVGWWPLEDVPTVGEIPWYDISGNNRHGHGAGTGVTSYSGADVPCSIAGELGQSLRTDFATGTEVVDAAINDFQNAKWSKASFTASNATTLTATLAASGAAYSFWNQFPSVVGGGYSVGDSVAFEFEARVASGSLNIRSYISGNGGIYPSLRWSPTYATVYTLGTEWKRIRVSADVSRIIAAQTNQVQPIFYVYDSDNGGAGGTYTFECRNVKLFTNVSQHPTLAKATDLSKDVRGASLQYPGPLAKRATMAGSPCATFDGSNDIAAAYESVLPSVCSAFSAAGWARFTTTGRYHALCGEWSGNAGGSRFVAFIRPTNEVVLYVTENGTSLRSFYSAQKLTINQWHHVAVTFAANTLKIYIDGVESAKIQQDSATVNTLNPVNYPLRLGSADVVGERLIGSLAGWRVYGSALAASDILALYQGGEPATAPVAHYPLSENSGLRLNDVSGNGKHLTVTGATSGEIWANTQSVYHYGATYGIRNPIGARRGRTLNGSTQYFTEKVSSRLNDPAATGMFWVCWYGKFDAASAALQGLVARWEGAGASGWILYRLNATTVIMEASYDLTNSVNAQVTIADDQADHLIFGFLDMRSRKIGIYVDAGAVAQNDWTAPKVPVNPLCKLRVGAYGTAPGAHVDGVIRRAAFGQVTGSVDAATIRMAIYNSGSPLLYSQLTDQQRSDWGLISWYDCDEWGPQLIDRHGANDLDGIGLTADYPAPQVPALITEPTRHYGDFAGAYALVGPDDAKFEATAGSKFWVAAWVRFRSLTGFQAIVSKYNATEEWALYGDGAVLKMIGLADGVTNAVASSPSDIVRNQWQLVTGYVDNTAAPFSVGVAKNGDSFTTATAASGQVRTGADLFAIGKFYASYFPDADIAFVATGKAATATFAQIRDALYNSGTPLTYDQLDASQKVAWGLTEWFEVGEYEGTEQLVGKHAATVLNGSCIPSRTTHGGPKKLAPVATAIDFTGGIGAPWTDKQFLGYWTCSQAAAAYVVTPAIVGKFTDAASVFVRVRNINTGGHRTFVQFDDGGSSVAYFNINAISKKLAIYDTTWREFGSSVEAIVTDGRWHDVLWVWSGTNVKCYLDNVLIGELTATNVTAWADLTYAGVLGNATPGDNYAGDIARIVVAAGIRVPGNILSSPNILDIRFDGGRLEDHQGRFAGLAPHAQHTPAKLTVPTAYKHGVILPAGMSKQTNGRSESAFALYSVDQ